MNCIACIIWFLLLHIKKNPVNYWFEIQLISLGLNSRSTVIREDYKKCLSDIFVEIISPVLQLVWTASNWDFEMFLLSAVYWMIQLFYHCQTVLLLLIHPNIQYDLFHVVYRFASDQCKLSYDHWHRTYLSQIHFEYLQSIHLLMT